MSALFHAVIGKMPMSFKKESARLHSLLSGEGRLSAHTVSAEGFTCTSFKADGDMRTLHYSDPGGRFSLVVSGNIYSSDGTSGKSDLDRAVNAYLRHGHRFSSCLYGTFVVIVHDHISGETTIANDLFGLHPCYYTVREGAVLLASEAEIFPKSGFMRPELDHDALAELFIAGSTMGERTLLKGVSRLRPGSTMVFKQGSFKVTLDPQKFKYREGLNDPDELFEEIDRALCKAVKDRSDYISGLGQKMELSLSGGLDSRLILDILLKTGRPFKAITCEDRNGTHKEDIEYTRLLSERFGFEHEVYQKTVGKATRFKTMLQPFSHLLSKPYEITGYAGEVLKGEYFKRVLGMAGEGGFGHLGHIFTKEFRSKLDCDPAATMMKEMDMFEHPDAEKRAEMFYIDHMGAFFRAEMPPQHRPKHLFLNQSHFPYLDRELVTLVNRMPMAQLKGKRFYLEYLKRMHPDCLADPSTTIDRLPTQAKDEYDLRLTPNQEQFMRYLEAFRTFSPLWEKNIFTDGLMDKHDSTLACTFNVWHDFYFRHFDSVEKMKEIENRWLFSGGDGRICHR